MISERPSPVKARQRLANTCRSGTCPCRANRWGGRNYRPAGPRAIPPNPAYPPGPNGMAAPFSSEVAPEAGDPGPAHGIDDTASSSAEVVLEVPRIASARNGTGDFPVRQYPLD